VKAVKRHKKKLALTAIALTLLVLIVTGALPDLPDAEKLIEDVANKLGKWTYALVGVMAFLETGAFVGLVAPGETVVIVGGVIAGQGEISLIPLIGLVWFSCVLGDTTSFFIGRRLGRGFLLRHGPKVKIDENRLEQVESYFERHGGKTILIGRFIGLVRAISPFVAGSSGLRYRRFLPFSIIGCGLWGTLYCVLGYLFYRSFDRVTAIAGKATFAFGITVAVIVGAVWTWRRLRNPEERRAVVAWLERQEQRRALRPVFAVLAPVWRHALRPVWRHVVHPAVRFLGRPVRFLGSRLTPGHLGLELTSVLAVAAVGAYVFAAYATMIADDPGVTPADRELLDAARDMQSDALTSVVKTITVLGSPVVTGWVIFGVGMVLLLRRHVTEVVALVTGVVLVYVAVRLTKEGIDRPRPPDPLVRAPGRSFPSGHAAYSTFWVAAAVAVGWCMPGLARRTLLIGAAIVVAAAVGLSRIYLRVHYWSDVAAGWALGAAILGLCGAAALTVAFIRQNGQERAPSDPVSWPP
jgi:membrane protein DedA with SNARE-associated domain/membrane-associated phospholipid phosphatase